MKTDDYILTYELGDKIGVDQIGAKAFNIACCNNAGFRVPDSLIISTQAFRAYLNGDNLETLFSNIKEYFADTISIIVRSSALEEDTEQASFAGQYLSLICLNNEIEIKKACEACWSAYSSSDIRAYKTARSGDVSLNRGGMGLLIQRVVNATSSGVCFTKDPLRNEKGVFIINAVHGLSEALVASEVVSDHYEYSIRKGNVTNLIIGKQTHWRSLEFPQELTPLPRDLRSKPVLSHAQIDEIAGVAKRAERLFQTSLDIEWAYEGEKLFLLQARPVTSVLKTREYELWTRDNVADVIPDAVTPLTWSVVKDASNQGIKKAFRKLGVLPDSADLFMVFDGRVYFNKAGYQRELGLRPEKSRNPFMLFRIGLNYLRILLMLRKKVSGLEETFLAGLRSVIVPSRINTIIALRKYLSRYMATHFLVSVLLDIGFIIIRRLMKKNMELTELRTVIDGVVTGLNEIESTASRAALWKLASMIKEDEELAKLIQKSPARTIPNTLKTWSKIYKDSWQRFLDLYGHSSLREFEIYYPRWKEDPGFVVSILQNYVAQYNDFDVEKSQYIREEIRLKSKKMLIKIAPLPFRPLLRFYIRHVQQCTIWRESIKQKIVKIMAEIRTQAISFAHDRGIKPVDGIFFLTLEEIAEFEKNPISRQIHEKIERSRNSWEIWEQKKPFREIRVFANGQTVKIPHLIRSGIRIQGQGLSSGKYSGRARIILDPKDVNSFNLGDILVIRSTNPSWTPLFTLAGAIVADMGNYLSHGAIIARELGIPAVGNLLDGTARIKNGQIIEVDGNSGTVILSEEHG